jgi:hypothetical protein
LKGGRVAGEWGAINEIADNVIITVGIGVLIVRQFLWRSTQLHRMLRMPVLIIAVGILYLVAELSGSVRWAAGDWFIVAELGLVAFTGTAMGYVTRFRTADEHLQYRLTTPGIALWAAFIGIRVGFFFLVTVFGARLGDATGVILLSFGVNRLAAILVVRRRAEAMLRTTQPAELERASEGRP